MSRFSILMLAVASCFFSQEANAQDRSKVIGYFKALDSNPDLVSHWEFTAQGQVIRDGKVLGTWTTTKSPKTKLTVTVSNVGKLRFEDNENTTLVGKKTENKQVVDWRLVRIPKEQHEAAVKKLELAEVPDLLRRLKDNNPKVRTVAVDRLASMISLPKEALTPLLVAMNDDDNSVKFYATKAVGKIGPDATDAIPTLAQALTTDQNGQLAIAALMSLGQIGKPAVPTIIKGLTHNKNEVRGVAADTLGKLGKDAAEAVPLLLAGLNIEQHDKVRIYFALGVARIDPDNNSYLPILIAGLDEGRSDDVRMISAIILGELGVRASAAVPALEKAAMSKSNTIVSRHAATALQKIKSAK